MISSNREEFNKHVTAKREEMNVKIVTMDVIFFLRFGGSSHPNRTGK